MVLSSETQIQSVIDFAKVEIVKTGSSESSQSRWCQYLAGMTGATSLLASGAWFTWPAPLLPRLLAPDSPVPMSAEQVSWMVSCVEIGNLIVPFPATYIADRYGRKFCLLLSAPLFFIGFCMTVYIKTFPSLCIARIIHGIAMGIPYTVIPIYLGEIASPKARGTVTSLYHIFFGLGCLFPYCFGPYLSYDALSYATLLLTVLFLLCFFWQPESPYFYAMKENTTKATNSLKRLRHSPTVDYIQKELKEIQLEVKKCIEEKSSWNDIFKHKDDRKALLLIIIIGVVSFLSGQNAILTYTTDTFAKFPNTLISPDFVTIGIGIVALLGSIFSLFISDRLGRRFLLLTSATGCMISLFIASAYFYIFSYSKTSASSWSWVAPVAVMAFNLFLTAGMHPVLVTYTSELFPTKTRGVAAGISAVNLTVCSFLVLKLYLTISALMGVYFVYLSYGIICFIGVIIFYFSMPETKGKTFLEIRKALVKT